LARADFWQPNLPETIFSLIYNLIINYLITVIIEALIIRALFRTFSKELFLTILYINFITNPTTQIILWNLYFFLDSFLTLILVIIILEIYVVYIEWILLFDKIQKKRVIISYQKMKRGRDFVVMHFNPKNEKRYVLMTIILANLATVSLIIFPLMFDPPLFVIYPFMVGLN